MHRRRSTVSDDGRVQSLIDLTPEPVIDLVRHPHSTPSVLWARQVKCAH